MPEQAPGYAALLRATIRVPPNARTKRLWIVGPFSTRLGNALERTGFKMLGDLNGLKLADLARRQGFGEKTVRVLHGLLAQMGAILAGAPSRARKARSRKRRRPVGPSPEPRFDVPASARALEPAGVPLLPATTLALEKAGLRTLGDLHLVPWSNLVRLGFSHAVFADLAATIGSLRERRQISRSRRGRRRNAASRPAQ